jgi:hypothetical protein
MIIRAKGTSSRIIDIGQGGVRMETDSKGKANGIKEWAPVVTSSTCSEQLVSEGIAFSVKADLKPVGGPKFEFDNVIAKMAENRARMEADKRLYEKT